MAFFNAQLFNTLNSAKKEAYEIVKDREKPSFISYQYADILGFKKMIATPYTEPIKQHQNQPSNP